jgi:hypothetical protein
VRDWRNWIADYSVTGLDSRQITTTVRRNELRYRMTRQSQDDVAITEVWREILIEGHHDKPSSYLPGSHRCNMCLIPLSGFGGMVMKTFRGRTTSRKNSQICNL